MMRWVEDGMERLTKHLTVVEAERARKAIQKSIPGEVEFWRRCFLGSCGTQQDWEESCKDLLEGYSRVLAVAYGKIHLDPTMYGIIRITPDGIFDISSSGVKQITPQEECDEPIIVETTR